jgi:hypothetical protein
MEDILVDLITDKVTSVGIKEFSIGGLKASPSTGRHSIHADEK